MKQRRVHHIRFIWPDCESRASETKVLSRDNFIKHRRWEDRA